MAATALRRAPGHRAISLLGRLSACGAWISVAVGVLVLAGRVGGVTALQSVLPLLASMQPSAAAGFILVGLAVLLGVDSSSGLRPSMALAGAGLTVVLGVVALAGGGGPFHMATSLALGFALLGGALLLQTRVVVAAQWLAMTAVVVALVGCVGYLYGVDALYAVDPYSGMAVHSALTLLLAALAVLLARADRGFVALIAARGPGGAMLRRMLPAIVGSMLAAGLLKLAGEREGLFPKEFGVTVLVVFGVVVAAAVVWRTAASLQLAEAARLEAGERFRATFEQAAVGIAHVALDGRFIRLNQRFCDIVGYSHEKMVRLTFQEITHPDDIDADLTYIRQVLAREISKYSMEKRYVRSGGGVVWVDLTVSLVSTASASPDYFIAVVQDITQRKLAEEALASSARQYRALFEGANDAIVIFEPEGEVILEANPSACALYGFAHDELVGMSLKRLSQNVARGEAQICALLASGSALNFETVHLRRDETAIDLLVNSSVIEFNGRTAILSLNRDITSLKRAEEQVRLLAQAIKSVSQCVSITDTENRVLFANEAFLRTYGYEEEELLGRPIDMVRVPHDGHDPARDILARTVAGGWQGEVVNRRRDGTTFPASLSTSVVRAEDGRPMALIGVATDVTERKRAIEALRESEGRYRKLFEEDLTGIFVSTPEGRLIDCNPAYASILGFASVEEALRADLRTIYRTPEDREALTQLLKEKKRLEYFPMELRRQDSSVAHVIQNIFGDFDDRGELVRIQGYLFDVSELRRLEEQLRQSQKMEAVGRLAGGIAHDFNNLLQAMLVQTQLLRFCGDGARAIDETSTQLEEQVRRGAALTRQLLLFSRRETAQPVPLDLNDVVTGATNLLRRLVRENIVFDLDLASQPLRLRGDRGQLEQVLMNLVVNASDAMPDGGSLVMRTHQDDGLVQLSVQDSGHGIPPAIRERIFEPFFSTKSEGEGTGLGLSVVHGIVTQHGGRIEVDSRAGEGATFHILLPALSLEDAGGALADPGATGELPGGHGERVLVVEDEDAARKALAEILAVLGYEVTAVASGTAAVRLPEVPAYDALVTDLVLPDLHGDKVSRQLCERWPDLAVILMSGYTEDEVVRRGVRAGEVLFLQKPFDIGTLARELALALDQRRAVARPPATSRTSSTSS